MEPLDLGRVSRLASQVRGPYAHVERRSPSSAAIALWGDLPVGWAGRLAAGLAEHGLDTRRAGAVRSQEHGWLAEFEVGHARGVDPGGVDYLALCAEERVAEAELVISEFSLQRGYDAGLELWVVAPDRLGFLAALLGRLAFFSLFPEAMSITTVGEQAVDELRVRGLGGLPPVAEIEHALRRALAGVPSSVPPPAAAQVRRSTAPRGG